MNFMLSFYVLSLLSGFFELAPFVVALKSEGILAALIATLFYQLGNLTPCPLKLSRIAIRTAALAGTALFAAYFKTGFFPLLCAATALLSIAIQSARSMIKTNAPKPLKRLLRVVGFGLGFYGAPLLLLISGAAAALFVYTGKSDAERSAFTPPRLNLVNIAMVLHQIHYFSYCYTAIAFTAVFAGTAAALGLFLAGWAVYIIAVRFYRGRELVHSFFFGHSLLVLLLLGMFFVPSMALKAVFWVLTGIGGTTEFCLAKLSLERGGTPGGGTFAENAGHVLGVALGVIFYAITGDLLPVVLISAAAASGAIILMAAVYARPEKTREVNYACKIN